MKRTRGGTELCSCGHTACKKIINDSFQVMNSHLSKSRDMIDKGNTNGLIKELKTTLRELEKRVELIEEFKKVYARNMCEFVKKESINVRVKFDTPLKRSKFDGKIEERINQKYVKKKKTQRQKK